MNSLSHFFHGRRHLGMAVPRHGNGRSNAIAVPHPKDRAVGYKKGDFRGVLAVEWSKPTP